MIEFLNDELTKIKKQNLYRNLVEIDCPSETYVQIRGKKVLNLCSNNYLNYANHPDIKKAAIEGINQYGLGSTGSRLTTGTTPAHTELEEKLAKFKHTEAALYMSCGFVANFSTIAALVDKNDVIFTDILNHASIIDGIRLSKANRIIYKHNDMEHLESRLKNNRSNYSKALIVTDTVFSMDGDCCKLEEIINLKNKYNAFLMVDEAHATGILGPNGSGLAHSLGLNNQIEIQMGTLSKAVGIQGAYIAGSNCLIDYLRHKSRGFVYSTAPSPALTKALIKAIDLLMNDNLSRKKLWDNIKYFKEKILELDNVQLIQTNSAIFCLEVGDIDQTLAFQTEMFNKYNIFVSAIRPPTVKTPRIRICITSALTKEILDSAINAMKNTIFYL